MKHPWLSFSVALAVTVSAVVLRSSREPVLADAGTAMRPPRQEAPHGPRAEEGRDRTPLPAASARAQLRAELDHAAAPAGKARTVYLKVGLTGIDPGSARPPVNVAFVIDRSGSMKGAKLEQAREGAIRVVRSLRADDAVAVVAFDDLVSVPVPAGPLADPEGVVAMISRLVPGGQTALHAAVDRGAAQLLRLAAPRRLSRVILLSDGLANVGPSSPEELQSLGASLEARGISVTTMGIGEGYHEDLMVRLAEASGGNHMFVWGAPHLAEAMRQEIEDLLSAVAQDVRIAIRCEPGFVPVRILGREAEIDGQEIATSLRQLHAGREAYVVVELLAEGAPPGTRRVARVAASYTDMASGRRGVLASSVDLRTTPSEAEVASSLDPGVLEAVSVQLGVERSAEATRLRDLGRVEEARALLRENAELLGEVARAHDSPALLKSATESREDSESLDEASWPLRRKMMRAKQHGSGFLQAPEGIQKS